MIEILHSKPIQRQSRMEKQIHEYLNHLQYERGFADSTIVGRGKMLFLFAKFARKKPLSTLLVQKFLRYLLAERGWKPISAKDALRDIKCFSKYLYFTGKAKEDAAYKIPYPKIPETLPKRISAEDVRKIYSLPVPPKACRRIWITYNFYFELLAKTGLRKTEAKLLASKDFDFKEGVIHVRFSKGRRETYCLLPPDMKDRLKNWFRERELAPDDLVFISLTGKALNNEGIRFAMKGRAKAAGVNQRVFPHLLRHFFGTDLLKNGVDVAKVQRLMRHRKITSTQIYLDLVLEDLRKDLNKHSLIEKAKKQPRPRTKTPKQTVINIVNPKFIGEDFANWYRNYFEKGGGNYNELAPIKVSKPQMGKGRRGYLPPGY